MLRSTLASTLARCLLLTAPLIPAGASYAGAMPAAPSVASIDAPQLAGLGKLPVGVQSISMVSPRQPDLALMVKSGGNEFVSDRTLRVHLWYPAKGPVTPSAGYAAMVPAMGSAKPGASFEVAAVAGRDAAPAAGARYPLVLISHGFGGWGTMMSYLAESLASKGYVVAAIDHADQSFTDGATFGLSFGSVMLLRSRDQRFVIDTLLQRAASKDDAIGAIIDAKSVGLIGYSMGGFGALASAGAGYDKASASFKGIPEPALLPLTFGSPQAAPAALNALVLIAPWGGQVANRAWSPASLAAVRAPTLIISGDQDDIVDYKDGVSWLFAGLSGTRRHMLVYQNARHNIAGNPTPAAAADFGAREYFDEPVWRRDRLMAINQHFIGAFLDQHLKGDRSMAKYLDLSPVRANDAAWPLPFGSSSGAAFGTGSGTSAAYWPGFQRRWAVGLEMHRREPGK
ncbi:alpha/beta hydrolase family protein [Massilia glaciei]|uniref:Dienelactone hydrolase n=1 Tax=Massilia glaciei TaxID=1524097 RepID=A0A2U2I6W2_9BURK|nr:dienelactone hydrolase family protein [Massilia glaciei]PWF55496.1 dienelactone hydrolase [Massilia glaciei]